MLLSTITLQENAITHYNLAYTYQAKGEVPEAVKHYQKSLEFDENFAATHLNISICYFDMAFFEEAEIHIDKALELEPNMYQALGRKGELFRFFGAHTDAIRYYNRCLEIDPNNYQSLFGLSLSLLESGNNDGMFYLKQWFSIYKKDVLDGKSVMFIDLGWKRILPILFKEKEEDKIEASIGDMKFILELKSSGYIFIGTSKVGAMNMPVVGKYFEDGLHYADVVKQIQESVKLLPYPNQDYHVAFEGVSVEVYEREDHVYIELLFGNYQLAGLTDKGTKRGFYAFQEAYAAIGDVRIIIMDKENVVAQ